MKKRGTPPTIVKSHSTASSGGEKYRHLEDDVVTLGQMSDLAKTITVPHQVTCPIQFIRLNDYEFDSFLAFRRIVTRNSSCH